MYYPFCKRCQTKDNFGKKLCGSCKVTLAVATEVNTAINDMSRNRTKASRFLGFSSTAGFYKMISQIPEIHEAWSGLNGVPMDEVKKILGQKVLNKITFAEHRLWKKILRLQEYMHIDDDKQEEFVYWFNKNYHTMTLALAKEKLLEIDKDVIRL